MWKGNSMIKEAWIVLNDNYNQDEIDEVWLDKDRALEDIEGYNNDSRKTWWLHKVYVMDWKEGE